MCSVTCLLSDPICECARSCTPLNEHVTPLSGQVTPFWSAGTALGKHNLICVNNVRLEENQDNEWFSPETTEKGIGVNPDQGWAISSDLENGLVHHQGHLEGGHDIGGWRAVASTLAEALKVLDANPGSLLTRLCQ